jgi:hypothetical protein
MRIHHVDVWTVAGAQGAFGIRPANGSTAEAHQWPAFIRPVNTGRTSTVDRSAGGMLWDDDLTIAA